MSDIRGLDLLVILIYLGSMAGMASLLRPTQYEHGRVPCRWAPVCGLGHWNIDVGYYRILGHVYGFAGCSLRSGLAAAGCQPRVATGSDSSGVVFIPLFRHKETTTAFEYLGRRFRVFLRVYGTLRFIVLQWIRAAQVLFLLSRAIQALTGAPLYVVIIGTGAFVAFYTAVGGIDAVIWTDVIQTLVLLLGAIACTATIAFSIPGGLGEIVQTGMAIENRCACHDVSIAELQKLLVDQGQILDRKQIVLGETERYLRQ
jgi:solute:Na+ symporter, SSS family